MPRMAPKVNISTINRRNYPLPFKRRVREASTPKFNLSNHERQKLEEI